jgi:hypothetical protein
VLLVLLLLESARQHRRGVALVNVVCIVCVFIMK